MPLDLATIGTPHGLNATASSPAAAELGILALEAVLVVGAIVLAGRYAYRRVFEN